MHKQNCLAYETSGFVNYESCGEVRRRLTSCYCFARILQHVGHRVGGFVSFGSTCPLGMSVSSFYPKQASSLGNDSAISMASSTCSRLFRVPADAFASAKISDRQKSNSNGEILVGTFNLSSQVLRRTNSSAWADRFTPPISTINDGGQLFLLGVTSLASQHDFWLMDCHLDSLFRWRFNKSISTLVDTWLRIVASLETSVPDLPSGLHPILAPSECLNQWRRCLHSGLPGIGLVSGARHLALSSTIDTSDRESMGVAIKSFMKLPSALFDMVVVIISME